MDDNASHRSIQPGPKFEEALAQGAHLRRSKIGAGSTQTQLLHQDVRSRREQYAKLIRQEACATGSIDLEAMMQFLDPVSHVPPAPVDSIDALRLERQVGYDIPVVIAGRTIRETDNFGFDDQATGLQPGFRLIPEIRKERFRLAGSGRQDSGCAHERFDPGFQSGISGKSHQILDPFLFQEVEDGRGCKSTVEAHSNPRFGEGSSQSEERPHQDSDCATGAWCIAGAEDDREQVLFPFVIELKSPDHRQETETVVVSVEKAELLGTMGGIIGWIHVNRDTTDFASQATGVAFDHDIGQFFDHAEQFFRRRTIFKARECWLGTKILAVDRIAVEQELLYGILGQGVSIVAVGISGCNSVDPLPEKIAAAVDDFPGLPSIADALGNAIGERQLIIDGLQKYGATIGAAIRLIKGNGNGLEKFFVEENRLCGKLSHQKASVCVWNLLSLKYLYADGGFLF
jgi:hypothetical protein